MVERKRYVLASRTTCGGRAAEALAVLPLPPRSPSWEPGRARQAPSAPTQQLAEGAIVQTGIPLAIPLLGVRIETRQGIATRAVKGIKLRE